MERKKVFADTEFTGLRQDTSLISIGAITEDGQKFYAEFTDYNRSQVDQWIADNVVSNLLHRGSGAIYWPDELGHKETLSCHIGDREHISLQFQDWLKELGSVEFWLDYCSFDWVLINELWGGIFKKPRNIFYAPMDLVTLFKAKGIDPDVTREEFAGMANTNFKHNALWDALIIKACYEKLQSEVT